MDQDDSAPPDVEAEPTAGNGDGDQADGTRLGGSRRRWLERVMSGSVIGVVVTVAIFVATWWTDERRAETDRQVAAEQAWRQQLLPGSEFPGAELGGLSLRSLYAPEVDLSASNAGGTDFSDSVLTAAKLDAADLEASDFSRASLVKASLEWAVLDSSTLTSVNLDHASLRNASLRGASLEGASLWRTDLRGADLAGSSITADAGRFACWDESTVWAAGTPDTKLCTDEDAIDREPGAFAERWSIDTVSTVVADDEGPERYGVETAVTDPSDEVRLLVRFTNLGRVPVDDVNVVVEENGPGFLVPSKVTLFNGNYPEGYEYPPEAIQADATQVNVGIGDYDSLIDAFVQVDYRIDEALRGCDLDRIQIVAYASPKLRGAVNDSVHVLPDLGACPL